MQMSTTTEKRSAADDLSLALAKARYGIELTPRHKRLVATELARRAYLADLDHPTTGQELRMLRAIAGPTCNVSDEFAALVAAYSDWQRCEDNVNDVRFEYDPPPSSDWCFEHFGEALDDAVDELLGVTR
jgi:hypothetical protein